MRTRLDSLANMAEADAGGDCAEPVEVGGSIRWGYISEIQRPT